MKISGNWLTISKIYNYVLPYIQLLIPSRVFSLDDYAWSYTKSGVYSVKSGYKLAREIKDVHEPSMVLEPTITSLKSQLWKTKTSGKLKHFMWQALSGCVATYERLAFRHIGNEKGCPRCGHLEESINHLLFECPPALQVWTLSSYPSIPGLFPSRSMFHNMDYLFSRVKETFVPELQRNLFPWILWYIWKARNDKVFNGKEITPLNTLQYASSEEESWRIANKKENEEEMQDTEIEEASRTLLGDYLVPTCQIDASWLLNGPTTRLGWCLKDNMDNVLIGLKGCRQSLSPLHAELDGLIWALSCLKDKLILSIKVETDCSDLLKMIENPTDWPSFGRSLIIF